MTVRAYLWRSRASVAILRNGGYGDVFATLAAGQLRVQMAAELRLTLKYKLVPARWSASRDGSRPFYRIKEIVFDC